MLLMPCLTAAPCCAPAAAIISSLPACTCKLAATPTCCSWEVGRLWEYEEGPIREFSISGIRTLPASPCWQHLASEFAAAVVAEFADLMGKLTGEQRAAEGSPHTHPPRARSAVPLIAVTKTTAQIKYYLDGVLYKSWDNPQAIVWGERWQKPLKRFDWREMAARCMLCLPGVDALAADWLPPTVAHDVHSAGRNDVVFGKDYRDNNVHLNASLGPVEWYTAALDGEHAAPACRGCHCTEQAMREYACLRAGSCQPPLHRAYRPPPHR